MSIVACVKVQDGIALGCDSATQISGRDPQGNIGVLKVSCFDCETFETS